MKTFLFTLSLINLLLFSCKKEPLPEPSNNLTFEEVFKSGGEFEPIDNKKTITNTETTSYPIDSGTWVCTTNTYNVVEGSPDFPLYDPNSSVIYPGSLLQGSSLGKATPDIIALKRNSGDISIDLVNGSDMVTVRVNEIKKSTVTQALNDIIYQNNEVMAARFNFTYEKVDSKEELALELNLNAEIYGISAAGQLGYSNNDGVKHYLVTLKQAFFTMSIDIPSTYAEFFASTVKPKDLVKYVYAGNPATYISDVTYGRVFYLLIESTSSETKIEGAITGTFSGLPISGNANVNYLSSLDSITVKVLALGGDVSNTFSAINSTNLGSLSNELQQSADIRTGVPLSYVVRTVYNNKLVYNKVATEYDVTECEVQ